MTWSPPLPTERPLVAPSLLAADFGRLGEEIAAVEQTQKTPGTPLVAAKPPEVPPPRVPTDHIGAFTRTRDINNDNSEGLSRINNEPAHYSWLTAQAARDGPWA